MISAPQQILVESPGAGNIDSVAVTKEALPTPDGVGLFGDHNNHVARAGHEHQRATDNLPSEPAEDATSPKSLATAFDDLDPASWEPDSLAPPVDFGLPPATAHPTPVPAGPSSFRGHEKLQARRAKNRQVLMVVGIGLCSLMLAAGAFVLFLKWVAKPTTVASNDPANTKNVAQAANTPEQPAEELKTQEPQASTDTDASASLTKDNVPPNTPSETDPQAQGKPDAATNSQNPLPDTTASGNPPAASPAKTENDPLQGDMKATNNNTASTVAKDPATMNSDTTASAPSSTDIKSNDQTGANEPAKVDGQASSKIASLPPGLQSFAEIVDQSLTPLLPDATVPLAPAPRSADDQKDPKEARVETSPIMALPQDVDQKLAVTIMGLLIDERPLSEAIAALSTVTEIPIIADLDSLAAVGIDRNQSVKYRSQSAMTAGATLNNFAESLHLQFMLFENRLMILNAAPAMIKEKMPAELPIADLVSDAQQKTKLIEALDGILPELNHQVSATDTSLKADLEMTSPLLWYQVARLLQTWRAARDPSNAQSSEIVPPTYYLPGIEFPAIKTALEKPVKGALNPETLAQSWQRLAAEAGLTLWIDWPGLAGAGIPPDAPSAIMAYGRTLGDVLKSIETRYGVIFAVEDDKTLWVTVPKMHAQQPRLLMVPMGDRSKEEWQKALESMATLNPDGSLGIKLQETPDSKFLFIRCGRPRLFE